MSGLRNRGEIIQPTDTVQLRALFKDQYGAPVDLDAYPTVSIMQPSGAVSMAPTSAGVYQIETGRYGFDYDIGINGPIGVYNDIWAGTINGFGVESTLLFVVDTTQIPAINSDGYYHLGDDVGFNYSQTAIFNINKIIKSLRARLSSSGKAKRVDENGNVVYIDCDIYSVDVMVTFIATALSDFNQTPYFTNFTLEDTSFIDQFFDILVRGATIYALASKALIERGREFQITDNGLSFNPPTVSEMLNTQYNTVLANYWDQLKYIKNSMRPAPKGLGTMTGFGGGNPAILRMRHLRARRIY